MANSRASVVVTVGDDFMKDIHSVAERLHGSGLAVERVMPLTGVITGTCLNRQMGALKNVSGVLSVENQIGVQLPPMDAAIQ